MKCKKCGKQWWKSTFIARCCNPRWRYAIVPRQEADRLESRTRRLLFRDPRFVVGWVDLRLRDDEAPDPIESPGQARQLRALERRIAMARRLKREACGEWLSFDELDQACPL